MKLELFKDESGYVIRKGTHRNFCVVDSLNEKDLLSLHKKIGKVLNIPDFQADMIKARKRGFE